MMKKTWLWVLLAAALAFGYRHFQPQQAVPPAAVTGSSESAAEATLRAAFQNGRSNIQVRGGGTVVKTLPDDNKGSRHQRFILKLQSGQTLLVAHNIDLAPKIKGLKKGDRVEFYGEYEWSRQGGVIHWTHHDPQGRHADGWLKHKGAVYQ